MKKARNINNENYQQNYILNNPINKSPIRRNNGIKTVYAQKTPTRSRTPQKDVSPIKNQYQVPTTIRYISNVSPLKERKVENISELSNGKNIRYINYQNDNKLEASKKDKVSEYNKKSDRILQEENRLFGKLVDKLNSEKKGLSNESSQKTSAFAENSDKKQNKIEQTGQGTFKQMINQVKTGEMKSQIKPNKGLQNLQQPQNLSCVVYKIKNPRSQRQLLLQSNKTNEVNIPPPSSFLNRRKYSKPDDTKPIKQQGFGNKTIQQQDEYRDINLLLQKIQTGCRNTQKKWQEDEVKMSLKVQQSLSMDPYL